MRDPERIDTFCKRLAKAWHKIPDMRFFQLMQNLPINRDPFFIEDEEALKIIEDTVAGWTTPKNKEEEK